MKLNIICAYFPIKRTENSPHSRNIKYTFQEDDFSWKYVTNDDIIFEAQVKEDFLERGLKALRKNSVYKHNIIISTENNVHFNPHYLFQLKNKYNFKLYSTEALDNRTNSTLNTIREVIVLLPDDELTCFGYNIDTICGKYWDKYIEEMYNKFGDNYVYVPMWVEPRCNVFGHMSFCGEKYKDISLKEETTVDSIWNIWRKGCCHSLTMKYPLDRDYMVEKDLDNWSNICNLGNFEYFKEPCGVRNYCYYAAMIAKNKIFKNASNHLLDKNNPPDLMFDNNLGVDKIGVAKSHVFHIHCPLKLDDIEVMHES